MPEQINEQIIDRPTAGAPGPPRAPAPPAPPAPPTPPAVESRPPSLPAPPIPPGRKGLFDAEIITKSARETERKDRDNSISFDTKELKYYSYMLKLKEKIESIWHYPPEAARKGIFGDLLISFVILKDGSLGSVELVRTSGWRILDKAAIEALREGAPYWPLPDNWDEDALLITGHFIYGYYGKYLR